MKKLIAFTLLTTLMFGTVLCEMLCYEEYSKEDLIAELNKIMMAIDLKNAQENRIILLDDVFGITIYTREKPMIFFASEASIRVVIANNSQESMTIACTCRVNGWTSNWVSMNDYVIAGCRQATTIELNTRFTDMESVNEVKTIELEFYNHKTNQILGHASLVYDNSNDQLFLVERVSMISEEE